MRKMVFGSSSTFSRLLGVLQNELDGKKEQKANSYMGGGGMPCITEEQHVKHFHQTLVHQYYPFFL